MSGTHEKWYEQARADEELQMEHDDRETVGEFKSSALYLLAKQVQRLKEDTARLERLVSLHSSVNEDLVRQRDHARAWSMYWRSFSRERTGKSGPTPIRATDGWNALG